MNWMLRSSSALRSLSHSTLLRSSIPVRPRQAGRIPLGYTSVVRRSVVNRQSSTSSSSKTRDPEPAARPSPSLSSSPSTPATDTETPSSALLSPSPSPSPSASPSPSHSNQSQTFPKSNLVQRYIPSLSALSTRTGVPLPSLALSFLILHEITAVVPVILIYWIFSSLGIGLSLVNLILVIGQGEGEAEGEQTSPNSLSEVQVQVESNAPFGSEHGENGNGRSWTWRHWVREWYFEGERKIERVGKRYGILGYERASPSDSSSDAMGRPSDGTTFPQEGDARALSGTGAATKVADAIAAYVIVKALLPLRIAVSVGASPVFARYTLVPLQQMLKRFKR
ncbi:uncharacterized protein I303_101583 [Kwoniella dejecticola CBS 10117]|uniref:Uncharacterized protein n=1 Tax=Kwoniella dejecticola CBS 10117 TaxID=1296121 RepID=A0A1A6ADD3_9TREE|nr:uncharacterized protein I303_02284 [Kwoniella dejecticola CBS 10117]OBR88065.1 hypothetical protein I303_02284 [Kwoniella dejecticola CBS 10117]